MTRKDYMEGLVTHAEYYRSVYKAAGISYVNSPDLPRFKAALAAGDEHLNTIPLNWWDHNRPFAVLVRAFKDHGEHLTRAGIVCAHKQAAKDAAHD